MKTEATAEPKAPPAFEVLEIYERMITQRERDPSGYQLQHSPAERLALEYYERAKAKAEKEQRDAA